MADDLDGNCVFEAAEDSPEAPQPLADISEGVKIDDSSKDEKKSGKRKAKRKGGEVSSKKRKRLEEMRLRRKQFRKNQSRDTHPMGSVIRVCMCVYFQGWGV